MKRSNLEGMTFGELHVVGLSEISRNGHSRWNVKCSCGVEKTVLGTHLISGKIISCGHKMRQTGARNFKGYKEIPLSYFSSVKRGANGGKGRKPLPFDISIEDAWYIYEEQGGKCALSGLPIDFKSKTASLDRIDSSKGYTYQNCQWLHKDINMMKRHYTEDYFIELVRKVYYKWKRQFD